MIRAVVWRSVDSIAGSSSWRDQHYRHARVINSAHYKENCDHFHRSTPLNSLKKIHKLLKLDTRSEEVLLSTESRKRKSTVQEPFSPQVQTKPMSRGCRRCQSQYQCSLSFWTTSRLNRSSLVWCRVEISSDWFDTTIELSIKTFLHFSRSSVRHQVSRKEN